MEKKQKTSDTSTSKNENTKSLPKPQQKTKDPIPSNDSKVATGKKPSGLEVNKKEEKKTTHTPTIIEKKHEIQEKINNDKTTNVVVKSQSLSNTRTEKNEVKPAQITTKRQQRMQRDEAKEAEEFEKELRETEKKAVEEAKSYMRPIHLNIDKSARSKEDAEKSKEKEMMLIKKLCGEVREIAKSSNPEEREERRQEMEKVRSARLMSLN